MIYVTRFDGSVLYINPHQIEFMEETPDLVITMLSGRKVLTKDSYETVLNRIVEYRTRIVNEDSTKKPSFYGNED
ncbi:flagellar FlbD family protein [Brachyspira pilosicoli]|uniref:Flagellar FlbD family protein n=4 Tax=Brachyspira pilosicoli TaxID=52584 RepID=A0AAJ6G9S2_BRAPL|nr:flagellar FlbD family protein [Brachyspira pilosicoli]ADK30761.1 putative flagellar family protein [Brachyspira pilosicoli 95/1000]AGA67420.1 putative flagellar family protein [Brachyspira pilosicoli P43/6/78]MBW5377654.1 flagellar protein [Brachyspira pilosicoli]MBW5382951.1 flagellar protein [Brachyspira pilosicoli]MBW5391799.1 flagellar protein [Brachyspira pilosicoli]